MKCFKIAIPIIVLLIASVSYAQEPLFDLEAWGLYNTRMGALQDKIDELSSYALNKDHFDDATTLNSLQLELMISEYKVFALYKDIWIYKLIPPVCRSEKYSKFVRYMVSSIATGLWTIETSIRGCEGNIELFEDDPLRVKIYREQKEILEFIQPSFHKTWKTILDENPWLREEYSEVL
jgi:hypothetical protein